MTELWTLVVAIFGGLGLGVVLVVGYLLLFPEKAEKIGGWIAALFAKTFRGMDRTAVALKVQGTINSARASVLKNAPKGIIDKKLKIKFAANPEQATALLREGEVLVVSSRTLIRRRMSPTH